MKLKMFHAGDGDCLLVSDDDEERHILVDGGRSTTFSANTAPTLAMAEIDVVCVSHIDNDHISGIVRMLESEADWRRHAFETDNDLPTSVPSDPRPPALKEIWHNAMYEFVGPDLEVRARSALAISANVLQASAHEQVGAATENLAQGVLAGMELTRRISAEQLDIDLNESSDGALMTIDSARGRRIGPLRVEVIGPTQSDLDELRRDWKQWLDKYPTKVDDLRGELERDEEPPPSSSSTDGGIAAELGEGAAKLTPPNLASIMLLVEDRGDSLLLTGDGDSAQILRGLEHHGRLEPVANGSDADLSSSERFHATVLKVQHHGATANVTQTFVDRITADHYVFCGNGAHHNPELEVIEALARARFDDSGPDEEFTFWFSASQDTPGLSDDRIKHMKKVETLVGELEAESQNCLSSRFLRDEQFLNVL